jgi:universal stress protein A
MVTQTPRLILVPTDFSAPAAQALRYAAALGERFGAHLLVIYADPFVAPVDFAISAAGTFDVPHDELIEAAREQLQAVAETNISVSVPYDVRVVIGTPTEAVAGQVRESGADLVVLGTHGRTGLRRLLVGSVAEAVMRTSPAPVIAVHELAADPAKMQVIAARPASSVESRAALGYAGMLAGAGARFIEIPEEEDLLARCRTEGVDLIALGIRAERDLAEALRGTAAERILQHSSCPVLTVNTLTARLLEPQELALPC